VNHHRAVQSEACSLSDHVTDADFGFIDPPYNQGVDYGHGISDDRKTYRYHEMLRSWIDGLGDCLRPGGVIAVLISDAHAHVVADWMIEQYGDPLARIIWHERFSQYNQHNWTKAHRHLIIHKIEGPKHTWNTEHIRVPSQRMLAGDKRAKGPRVPDTVWTVRRLQGTSKHRVEGHPCQLPPEPLERLIHAYTNPGDTVAESCCGVGSLAVVAQRLNRRYTGGDLNPDFVAIANKRLDNGSVPF